MILTPHTSLTVIDNTKIFSATHNYNAQRKDFDGRDCVINFRLLHLKAIV